MSVYFYMKDLLDTLEKAEDRKSALNMLVKVSRDIPDCGGFPADAFILSSRPTLLDIDGEKAFGQMTTLLENVPLYQFNMELALDEALSERKANATVNAALEKAFAGDVLPNTMQRSKREMEEMPGSLRHPMLEHIDRPKLCNIYIEFLRALGPERPDFSFLANILGKHEEQFLEYFDGFVQAGRGRIKAEILLAFSLRVDHNPGKPMESFVQSGERAARKMNITEPHEMVWAWLEADHYQMRRCREIERAKQVQGLPRAPNWIRADVFALMEKETIKQFHATALLKANPGLSMLEPIPAVRAAVQANAEGKADAMLEQLMAQTVTANAPYAGSAGKFAEAAARRDAEARRAWLV